MNFTPFDHAARVIRLGDWLAASDVDALLVTTPVDIRWLTGFGGSTGWVVVGPDDLVLGTDGRYGERASAETAHCGATVIVERQRRALHDRLGALAGRFGTVGLDPSGVAHGEWTRLAVDLELREVPPIIGRLRTIKDAAEIERISAAAAAADAALGEVEPILLGAADGDVTEADIRNELEYRMRLHGADDRSYDTIVASGPDHAARPHHEVSRRRIVEGDTVIVDVGALVDGYHSDMTRSYVIGEPTPEQREVYALVEAAHRAGVSALRGGMQARELDAACRQVFDEGGRLDWYLHGTGHGVGLDIHEPPFLAPASGETIEVGNVVTVEPGLYRVGFGGFRIEDLLVVTEHGSRTLTHTVPRLFPG